MMNPDQVRLAQRIIGLKRTSKIAHKNEWTLRFHRDRIALTGLNHAGYVKSIGANSWQLTPHGIDQLRLQIGEFDFNIK